MHTKPAKIPTQLPTKIIVLVLYFCALILLIALGAWQLQRGLVKAEVAEKVSSQTGNLEVVVSAKQAWQDLIYVDVKLLGNWMADKSLLLDNRINKGQLGVEVLTPFQLQDDTVILVNRGWVATPQGSHSGNALSIGDIAPPLNQSERQSERQFVRGKLIIPRAGFTLGASYTETKPFPVTIQYFKPEEISRLIGRSVESAMLVMLENSTSSAPDVGFEVIWKPYIVNAMRHYGYAFQWWCLAVVLLIFGLIWQFRPSGRHDQAAQ